MRWRWSVVRNVHKIDNPYSSIGQQTDNGSNKILIVHKTRNYKMSRSSRNSFVSMCLTRWHTRTHQGMRQRTWTFTQCSRKLPEFAEITQNNAITPFKVIQVTDFRTNRKLIYDFLLVINTNLPPILHRFQDIAVDRSEIAILGYPSCV